MKVEYNLVDNNDNKSYDGFIFREFLLIQYQKPH